MKDLYALRDGVSRFLEEKRNDPAARFDKLVKAGQRPKILLIACCDSRVDPALVTLANPGDIFVVRNVANLVPRNGEDGGLEETTAALDFAVNTLAVRHILLMGHSLCGGIQGATDAVRTGHWPKGPLGDWLRVAEPAVTAALRSQPADTPAEELHCVCGRRSVVQSLANLRTFPWIQERVDAGTLFLSAWYFSLGRMEMEEWHEGEDRFVPLA
ncbi:MAG: hypothetical protein RJA70_2140 [Pseudomonadota bacterium]|jgi:carbonic anhydrase